MDFAHLSNDVLMCAYEFCMRVLGLSYAVVRVANDLCDFHRRSYEFAWRSCDVRMRFLIICVWCVLIVLRCCAIVL